MTIAFHFFSKYWHFTKCITLPIYRPPTLLSETKQGFKTLRTKSGAAPVTQPGNTRILIREPKHRSFSCIYDILNSFAVLSRYIEMVTYCTSLINNRTCHIAYKYTGIFATKLINMFPKGTRVRWSTKLSLFKKVVPTSKKVEKRCLGLTSPL